MPIKRGKRWAILENACGFCGSPLSYDRQKGAYSNAYVPCLGCNILTCMSCSLRSLHYTDFRNRGCPDCMGDY